MKSRQPDQTGLEQWVRGDLRTRFNDVMNETLPDDITALLELAGSRPASPPASNHASA